MKYLTSLALGILSGVAAIFLHLLAPPFGLILATVGTFTAIWSVGRRYGKRRFKVIAALAWALVFSRAAAFGSGKEIFIQGDNLGNLFLLFSFLALFIALGLPAN